MTHINTITPVDVRRLSAIENVIERLEVIVAMDTEPPQNLNRDRTARRRQAEQIVAAVLALTRPTAWQSAPRITRN